MNLPHLLPLRLRRNERVVGKTEAVLLPGSKPAGWIARLDELGVDDDTPLYPIPRSSSNPCCSGLLAPLPSTTLFDTGKTGFERLGMIPFRRYASLFLPADAELVPLLTIEEWAWFSDSRSSGTCWIFHPGTGLIRYQAEDAIHLSDLFCLGANTQSGGPWNAAQPGLILARRLASLESKLDTPMGLEFLSTNDGQRDSNEILGSNDDGLPGAHDEEIQGLLDLFESDPDKALRFAPPISGMFRGRGLRRADPADQLQDQGPIQNRLRGLLKGGLGGRARSFLVGGEMKRRLNRVYHSAARRELEMKRFVRAAVIYGSLLGDLATAANCLKQGRRFREAAQLYFHLKQEHIATKCLEQAGCLQEAAEMHLGKRRFKQAGILFRKVGMDQAADEAFRAYLKFCRDECRWRESAYVLYRHLADTDQALEVLEAHMWQGCQTYFDILGETGRHERAAAMLERMRKMPEPPMLHFLECLLTVSKSYPDSGIREKARRTGRAVISERMTHENKRKLGYLLQRFVPDDELLKRDLRRFYKVRNLTPGRSQRQRAFEELCSTSFSPPLADHAQVLIVSQRSSSGHFYCAMRKLDPTSIQIQMWSSKGRCVTQRLDHDTPEPGQILFVSRYDKNEIVVAGETQGALQIRGGSSSCQIDRQTFAIKSPEFLPKNIRALSLTDSNLAAIVQNGDGLSLNIYARGDLHQTIPLQSSGKGECRLFRVRDDYFFLLIDGEVECVQLFNGQSRHICSADTLMADWETGYINTKEGAFAINRHGGSACRIGDKVHGAFVSISIVEEDGCLYLGKTNKTGFQRLHQIELNREELEHGRMFDTRERCEFVMISRNKFRRFRYRNY